MVKKQNSITPVPIPQLNLFDQLSKTITRNQRSETDIDGKRTLSSRRLLRFALGNRLFILRVDPV